MNKEKIKELARSITEAIPDANENTLLGVAAILTEAHIEGIKEAAKWISDHEASFSYAGPPRLQLRYKGNGYRGSGWYYTTITDQPGLALMEAMLSEEDLKGVLNGQENCIVEAEGSGERVEAVPRREPSDAGGVRGAVRSASEDGAEC